MWQIFLQIGSLAGLLSLLVSIVGGLYLYLENRQFKKLDANKEYEIAQAIVRKFEDERSEKLAELEDTKRGLSRGRTSFEANRTFWASILMEEQSIRFKRSPEETKARAEARYYQNIRDLNLFWFLKWNRKGRGNDLFLD